VCAFLVALESHGEAVRPTLSNGVVSYVAEAGQRRQIQVGKKCADLWVAPDESVIAFIAIDKAQPATANEIEPFIEESSIYIARKSDHFKPVHLVVRVAIDRRTWKVVRQPSVSPDLKTVYFSVPFTMTSWKLLSTSLPAHSYTTIGNADSYCVIWGGEHSGELLMEIRREADPTDPKPGVSYPCYLRTKSGALTKVADEGQCWGFGDFAVQWSRDHGGTCQPADVRINN
jgi:hypothetical protein